MTTIRALLEDCHGHRARIVTNPRDGRIGIRCLEDNRLIDITPLLDGQPDGPREPKQPRTPPSKAEQCPRHLGQYRENCSSCAADAKAAHPDAPKVSGTRQGTDPTAHPEWARTKADMAERRRKHTRAAATLPDASSSADASAMTPPPATLDTDPEQPKEATP